MTLETENLNDPDIALGGLKLWGHGREFPDAQDAWDAQWLRATAVCEAPGAKVWTRLSLHGPDLVQWLAALEAMDRTLSGRADLVNRDPELNIQMTMPSLGRIELRVELTPDHLTQRHSFEFEIDQSYLKAAIAGCRAILKTLKSSRRPR